MASAALQKIMSASLLAFVMLASPSSLLAAAENAIPAKGAATGAPVQSDSKSYLPPWMQKEDGPSPKATQGSDAPYAVPPSVAAADDAANKKAKIPSQGPRSQHRQTNQRDASFLRGFVGIFGR